MNSKDWGKDMKSHETENVTMIYCMEIESPLYNMLYCVIVVYLVSITALTGSCARVLQQLFLQLWEINLFLNSVTECCWFSQSPDLIVDKHEYDIQYLYPEWFSLCKFLYFLRSCGTNHDGKLIWWEVSCNTCSIYIQLSELFWKWIDPLLFDWVNTLKELLMVDRILVLVLTRRNFLKSPSTCKKKCESYIMKKRGRTF